MTTHRSQILSSMAFAGTVLGMLSFGYLSDKLGRKFGMVRRLVGYRGGKDSCVSRWSPPGS